MRPTPTRRQFLIGSTAAAGALTGITARTVAFPPVAQSSATGYRPTVTPDGATLPFHVVDGVKVFHLIAEPVVHEFAPGLVGDCWGYNGRVHGPTIEALAGDRVRIYVTNRLTVSTTVHWHGVKVPSGMDGVGGLSQRPIERGETFKYEFTFERAGTFMYHSHHDEMTQMALGMMGMIVIHPREPVEPPPDRDFVYLLSEWKLTPGTRRPDPNEMMDFNVLTLNARIFPGTAPLVVKLGERVRIRIGNLSAMDHHPIHLHGHSYTVIQTDGGDVPVSARFPETSVLVPVGAVRVVEFIADNPGDWPLHCHMTHHTMTQMGHGIPNLTGTDPGLFDEQLSKHVPAFDAVGSDMEMGGGMSRPGDANETTKTAEPGTKPTGDMPDSMGGVDLSGDADPTIPPNSLPMMGGAGPHGYITMGGMFTILKVRESLPTDSSGGWYENPPGTLADAASPADLTRDGIRP